MKVMESYAQEYKITWAPEKCVLLSKHKLQIYLEEEKLPQADRFGCPLD